MKVKNDLLHLIVEITMSSQNIKKNIIRNITKCTFPQFNVKFVCNTVILGDLVTTELIHVISGE